MVAIFQNCRFGDAERLSNDVDQGVSKYSGADGLFAKLIDSIEFKDLPGFIKHKPSWFLLVTNEHLDLQIS